ncbi:Pkinase-domain-containing protein [Sporormia fimetaria CBS 119925]|uniref:cyclin-dependent kinase n=1 Tax=Sporormia fimetaria CBS 119925 TaxID=1340428 RepID=A0A6A6V9L5_9PLEO|nr:Pkinase-domain-containing protein [Sporormia fimetaria CBS 119925]
MPGASRWANDEADAAEDARRKKEKEDKKRAKQLKQEREAAAAAAQEEDTRPSKRRKLSPTVRDDESAKPAERQLLRFEGGSWGRCRHVDNYNVINHIEQGTFGVVSRAIEVETGEVVALKMAKHDERVREADGYSVPALREVEMLRKARHPNIVALKEVVRGGDYSVSGGPIYLVLEFVEHDLRDLMNHMPEPFVASEIKTLFRQLVTAVDFLHTNHIMHRDLKTSNILLSNRGHLKLADFGMARTVPPPSTPNIPTSPLTTVVVTLWYRAPELLLGAKTYTTAIDIWSLGCIFSEFQDKTNSYILKGKNEVDQLYKIFSLVGIPTEKAWPSFSRLPNAKALKLPRNPAKPPSLKRVFPSLTDAGVDLLSWMLESNPDRRATAKDILSHVYFEESPKPKPMELFPTFPSKAAKEKRKEWTPEAPKRGEGRWSNNGWQPGEVDFTALSSGREKR